MANLRDVAAMQANRPGIRHAAITTQQSTITTHQSTPLVTGH
jgi:hypothetical protein